MFLKKHFTILGKLNIICYRGSHDKGMAITKSKIEKINVAIEALN